MKLAVLYFVIRQNQLQEFGEDASAVFEKQFIVGRTGRYYNIAAFFSFRTQIAVQKMSTVFIVCGPPPKARIAG